MENNNFTETWPIRRQREEDLDLWYDVPATTQHWDKTVGKAHKVSTISVQAKREMSKIWGKSCAIGNWSSWVAVWKIQLEIKRTVTGDAKDCFDGEQYHFM